MTDANALPEDFDPSTVQPSAEELERNELMRPSAEDRCAFCLRPMANYEPGKVAMIHLNSANGNYFRVDLALDDDPRSQGWFSIGPVCAKKLPSAYVSRPAK